MLSQSQSRIMWSSWRKGGVRPTKTKNKQGVISQTPGLVSPVLNLFSLTLNWFLGILLSKNKIKKLKKYTICVVLWEFSIFIPSLFCTFIHDRTLRSPRKKQSSAVPECFCCCDQSVQQQRHWGCPSQSLHRGRFSSPPHTERGAAAAPNNNMPASVTTKGNSVQSKRNKTTMLALQ